MISKTYVAMRLVSKHPTKPCPYHLNSDQAETLTPQQINGQQCKTLHIAFIM